MFILMDLLLLGVASKYKHAAKGETQVTSAQTRGENRGGWGCSEVNRAGERGSGGWASLRR